MNKEWITTDRVMLRWDTKRLGRIVCSTSPHADGEPRVIVEWDDGTEGKVKETDLLKVFK